MADEIQFDPALKQLLLRKTGDPLGEAAEISVGGAAEEIPVVARLLDPTVPVPGLQVVSRLGNVVTGRLPLDRIVEIRGHPNVASLKDSATLGADLAVSVPDICASGEALRAAGLGHLSGRGVVVGVVDWGCDFVHANFRDAGGRTRLLALWDQRGEAQPGSPAPYGYGRELNRAAINAALAAADPYAALSYDPAESDPGGRGTHGTHVLDIAAGNGRATGSAAGVAPGADLLFVHLRGNDTHPEDTLGDSVRLLEAVDYIIHRAGERPVVVNLSLGRTGGPKDASTLVEQALDALLAERDGRAICMSTGNYFDANLHSSGRLDQGATRALRWQVTPRNNEFAEMELWYAAEDEIIAELIDPFGNRLGQVGPGETDIVRRDGTILASLFNRRRDPNNGDNQLNLFLWPDAPVGMWTVGLRGERIHDGTYHAWIERDHPARQSHFHHQDSDPQTTVGTICTGHLTIPVGAYDARARERPVVFFSSSGPSRDGRQVPLISAPGAGIRAAWSSAPDVLGRRTMDAVTVKSGSSMAAPHVAGLVALLFEAALPRRLTANEVRHILTTTARTNPPSTAEERLRYGAGRVNAAAAIQAVSTLPALAIRQERLIVPATNGSAAPVVELALREANGTGEDPMINQMMPSQIVSNGASMVETTRALTTRALATRALATRALPLRPRRSPLPVEAATDPVVPVRPPLTIRESAGRRGRNRVDDVRVVQAVLRDLRFLSAADFATESPAAGATGNVAEARLTATIAAIDSLQRAVQGRARPDGRIDSAGATMKALNRAIPQPTAAEFAAISGQLATMTETIVRGVALMQPVGNVSNAEVAAGRGNLPDEVRAVQARLMQLAHLRPGHGEIPLAGAAAAQLPRTRAAITAFQRDEVAFWRGRGEVAGAVTPGVVAPNDATHQLLHRITSYREQFASGEDIRFRDFVKSGYTRDAGGVMFAGTAAPAALANSAYQAAGLTADQTAALQFVSRHEGNFDALNTYDVARVSFGFIQFAGGRGLPPFLALLKSRQPQVFANLLGAFGIEVEFNVEGGGMTRITNATVVVVDPAARAVLRDDTAEAFIRDTKKLSAVLIRAGRNTTVQEVQVEAATRDYLLPALATNVEYEADIVEELAGAGGAVTATHVGAAARRFRATAPFATLQTAGRIRERRATTRARLETLIDSQQGVAILLDRVIQEGIGGGTTRLARAIRWVADQQGLADVAAVAAHEGAVLQQVLVNAGPFRQRVQNILVSGLAAP